MHPPYVREKQVAAMLASRGHSMGYVAAWLRERYDVGVYVAHTIARHAVEDAESARQPTPAA